MNTAFAAGEVFTGQEILTNKAILVSAGKVVGIVDADSIPAKYRLTQYGYAMLAPAFLDMQIYGGNGLLFSEDLTTASLLATYEYALAGGCTQFMITMATNSIEKFLAGMQTVRAYWQEGGKGLLGLHLEGPYISVQKKGAHIEQFIRTPTLEEIDMILEKGKGVLKMITLAPEQCSPEIVSRLLSHHIIVSAGHSNASYDNATAAFNQGVPCATHLFNAMSALQGREPGLVGAIFDHSKAMSSIICDGIHVSFDAVRISKKIMGERLYFITDAVTEITHGEYQHQFRKDHFTLPDGTLSGSALTMIQAVRNAVERVDIPVMESLRMASLYPARLLGLDNLMGVIAPGAMANFVLLDEHLNLRSVIVDGE